MALNIVSVALNFLSYWNVVDNKLNTTSFIMWEYKAQKEGREVSLFHLVITFDYR